MSNFTEIHFVVLWTLITNSFHNFVIATVVTVFILIIRWLSTPFNENSISLSKTLFPTGFVVTVYVSIYIYIGSTEYCGRKETTTYKTPFGLYSCRDPDLGRTLITHQRFWSYTLREFKFTDDKFIDRRYIWCYSLLRDTTSPLLSDDYTFYYRS